MAFRIENRERESSAAEVVERPREPENEALLQALDQWEQRKREEGPPKTEEERVARARHFLEHVVWPNLPPSVRGKSLSKEEEEEILGFGPEGV